MTVRRCEDRSCTVESWLRVGSVHPCDGAVCLCAPGWGARAHTRTRGVEKKRKTQSLYWFQLINAQQWGMLPPLLLTCECLSVWSQHIPHIPTLPKEALNISHDAQLADLFSLLKSPLSSSDCALKFSTPLWVFFLLLLFFFFNSTHEMTVQWLLPESERTKTPHIHVRFKLVHFWCNGLKP